MLISGIDQGRRRGGWGREDTPMPLAAVPKKPVLVSGSACLDGGMGGDAGRFREELTFLLLLVVLVGHCGW